MLPQRSFEIPIWNLKRARVIVSSAFPSEPLISVKLKKFANAHQPPNAYRGYVIAEDWLKECLPRENKSEARSGKCQPASLQGPLPRPSGLGVIAESEIVNPYPASRRG